MKYYTLFAGVNGAGKSTAYQSQVNLQEEGRINSDEILRGFSGDWRSSEDQYEAGKIALKRICEYFDQNISFSQETTLSSRGVLKYAKKAKELGYTTEMHYVGVDSAETAIERIKERVANGGHGIDDELVRRRYKRSLLNLKEAINVFDIVFLYDNTIAFKIFATYFKGVLVEKSKDTPEWYKNALNLTI